MTSQYQTIDGVKYERDLLALAETFKKSRGSLDKSAAEKLWTQAMDGNKVTPTERRTLEYIMENYKVLSAARAFLVKKLEESSGGAPLVRSESKPLKKKKSQYYKWINGIAYDRELLEQAEDMKNRRGGVLNLKDVLQIWANAHDGHKVTEVEKRTLVLVRETFPLALEAAHVFDTDIRSLMDGSGGESFAPALEDKAARASGGVATTGSGRGEAFATASGVPALEAGGSAATTGSNAPGRGRGEGSGFLSGTRGAGAHEGHKPLPIESGSSAEKPVGIAQRFLGSVRSLFGKRSRVEDVGTGNTPAAGSVGDPGGALQPRSFLPPEPDVPPPTKRLRTELGERSSSGDALREDLAPELQELLALERPDGEAVRAIEWVAAPEPAAPSEAERLKAKAKEEAKAEVERILAVKRVADVLGGGSKEQQLKEFKRIALLLHPDKGVVEPTDQRARLALALVTAAKKKLQRDA